MNNFREFLLEEYKQSCHTSSDINEHLPVLHDLANRCNHITEFGVRQGVSSRALLSSKAKHVRMYDLTPDPNVEQLVSQCVSYGMDVSYMIGDVLSFDIDPTDLLFIDTWHVYKQLRAELLRHAVQCKRFLAFHDTHTFGTKDHDAVYQSDLESIQNGPGLLPAIIEFMIYDPNWRFIYHTHRNNGFTVLERTNRWCG